MTKEPDIVDKLMADLETQSAKLSEVIFKIQNDEIPELSAVDNDISHICDQIDQLPEEQAKKFEQPMGAVIHKLDLVARELNNYQERVSKRVL